MLRRFTFGIKTEGNGHRKDRSSLTERVVDIQDGLGTHLNGMIQVVIRLGDAHPKLLTSDQPLIVSGGLGLPDTFCMLPISPRHLFICTNKDVRMDHIKSQIDSGRVVYENNASVAMNAEKFVYATSLDQLDFVRQHYHCEPLPR